MEPAIKPKGMTEPQKGLETQERSESGCEEAVRSLGCGVGSTGNPIERHDLRSASRRPQGRERRRFERRRARGFVRYRRLWQVEVVDIGPSGLRVESELPFRFGPGQLHVPGVGGQEELGVVLLWSRLVATRRGEFGEICPRFHSGLAVDGVCLDAWRAALPGLGRGR